MITDEDHTERHSSECLPTYSGGDLGLDGQLVGGARPVPEAWRPVPSVLGGSLLPVGGVEASSGGAICCRSMLREGGGRRDMDEAVFIHSDAQEATIYTVL